MKLPDAIIQLLEPVQHIIREHALAGTVQYSYPEGADTGLLDWTRYWSPRWGCVDLDAPNNDRILTGVSLSFNVLGWRGCNIPRVFIIPDTGRAVFPVRIVVLNTRYDSTPRGWYPIGIASVHRADMCSYQSMVAHAATTHP